MRRAPVVPLLALAVLAAGCARKAAEEDAPAAVAEVATATLAAGDLDRTVTAFGAAEFAGGGEATLAAPMEASVTEIAAGPGTMVRRGEPVVQLAPSVQSRADLAKAASDAAQAAAALARAERLRASGLDSDADVETARAADVAAQAVLRALQARRAALGVGSPVSGVVESVAVGPRDLVAAGAALAKVGRLSDLRVRLGLDPARAADVRPGAPVRLEPIGGGEPIDGRVTLIDRRLDPQTHLAGVMVVAPPARLAPGEALRGEIVLGRAHGAVAPRRAILWDGASPYVLVVADGKVHRRTVTLAAESGETVLVASGAQAGERIVTDGGASLDDGAAVREAPARPAGGDDPPAKDAP